MAWQRPGEPVVFRARPARATETDQLVAGLRSKIEEQRRTISGWSEYAEQLQRAFDELSRDQARLERRLQALQEESTAREGILAGLRRTIEQLRDSDDQALIATLGRAITTLERALEGYAGDESWSIDEHTEPLRTRYVAADDGRWAAQEALDSARLERTVLELSRHTAGIVQLARMRDHPASIGP